MLSLQPQYYRELCSGIKKTEYRRGAFIKEPVQAFVYCSTPVAEVGVYVRFGEPITGTPEEIALIKEAEAAGSYDMMMEWMRDYKEASAIPIEEVKTFSPVTLQQLRNRFGKFHPPQRYTYLDKRPDILSFLQKSSGLPF